MSAGLIARALVGAVKFYRALPRSRPPSCRFDPTCSQYALDALRGWGALRGSWLAMRRICRCHPWGGWGYDPVPERSDAGAGQESAHGSDSATEKSEHSCST